LRAALKWLSETNRPAALSLAAALGMFWSARGYYAEGRGWLAQLLAHYAAPDAVRAKGLRMAALLAQATNRSDRSPAAGRGKRGTVSRLNDAAGAAWALRVCGWALVDQGEHAQAGPVFEEALRLAREAGDAVNTPTCWGAGLRAEPDRPRCERARLYLMESMALYRRLGRQEGIAFALVQQGLVEVRCGTMRARRVCSARRPACSGNWG